MKATNYILVIATVTVAVFSGEQPALAASGPCTLADLGWMAASWINVQDPKGAQENWTVARGGILMGSAFEFPQGQRGYAEIMSIREDGGVVSMNLRHFDAALTKAWEERNAPMIFRAASCGRKTATFEGQSDHAGEKMTYTRDGDHLLIVADFLHGGKTDHEEWRMKISRK